MIDDLIGKIKVKGNVPLAIGIDPIFDYVELEISKKMVDFPKSAEKYIRVILEKFSKTIIDAVFDIVPAIKFQSAYFEIFGWAGIAALTYSIDYAKSRDLFVILDVKRGDIGSTSSAYASACLGRYKMPVSYSRVSEYGYAFSADASTVNPYFGSDGVLPFVKICNDEKKSIFVLVATSNESSFEIQDLKVGETPVYEKIGEMVNQWGKLSLSKSGYSNVGAVVGATRSSVVGRLRKIMKNNYFLVPGIGTQGGDLRKLSRFFNEDGFGALVVCSRQIIYAFREKGLEIGEATRKETEKLSKEIKEALNFD